VAGQVPDTGLPIGTVLVYNAHLDQSFWSLLKTGIGSPDTLFQAIKNTLWMKWDLDLVKSDYSSISSLYFGATPITLTVQLAGPKTYAQPDDIRGIIDGEIIDALASNPITDSNISSWTIPKSAGGSGKTTDTGAPAVSTSPLTNVLATVGLDPGAISDLISNAISNAVKNATSGLGAGTGIIVIVLGLAIVAAVLIGVAPTSGARAYRAFQGRR
jgi:hypothetical protein